MLHDLHSAASGFETLIKHDIEALKGHRVKMGKEKDAGVLKDILKMLKNLEYDTARYKEWVEREAEGLENYGHGR